MLAKSRLRFGLQVQSKTETKPNVGFKRVCEEQSANFSIFDKNKISFEIQIFKKGNGQKRKLPVLLGQKRMYSENNSGREGCWPYLIGQHPLSPVFGQKRPGTLGNSYFAQLPPVFGHFMFRFWLFYVPFRWADTRLLEQINMGATRTTNSKISLR